MKKLIIILLTFFTLSCSKDDDNSSTPQETPVDVYVGGTYGINPAIWRNGESPSLITTTGTSITVNSMFIEGNDQYLVGSEVVSSKRLATIWKNGTPTRLYSEFYEGNLTDIIVKNGTSHCVGYFRETVTSKERIMYLINTNGLFVTNGMNYATPSKMFIKDEVVYIAGSETTSPTNNTQIAKYWRNGVSVSLSTGTTEHIANDIFVDTNNDVYVCGISSNSSSIITTPKYWKNGIETVLQTPNNGNCNAILKVGNDVYVVGYVSNFGSTFVERACYWKNGVRTDLPNTAEVSSATDIMENQGNIYISGSFNNGGCYWKNDVVTNLTIPGTFGTYISSIFVK